MAPACPPAFRDSFCGQRSQDPEEPLGAEEDAASPQKTGLSPFTVARLQAIVHVSEHHRRHPLGEGALEADVRRAAYFLWSQNTATGTLL
ncbi:hypothetical protein NDU88_007281 [Pleurodeles waltl]|uniref:Uncharacterized protein n=1 Tax=Pleurodeles waltl TaxID=8319 RepID=A0AAV7VRQ4_PLEWA|nr:hypothetical protein NDU88_007281 [Pleurodeles waltl]